MKAPRIHCDSGGEGRRGVRLGREAAGRHVPNAAATASYSVIRSSIPSHPSPARSRIEHRRQPDVQHPQQPRRLADALRELGDLRARQLRLEELAAADAQPREDGDGEDDDAHASDPLRELTPHASDFEISSKSVTTLAPVVVKPGHALEVRVDRVAELISADEQVRQRGERRCEEPRHGDDEEALADADAAG